MTPAPDAAARALAGARFDPATGLAPAIVQSAKDGRVLMLGWMSREALEATLRGRVTFHSRSRGRLWEKGETSGHRLETVEVRLDCDGDAILVRAIPHGPACHTGAGSCFDAGARAGPDGSEPTEAPGSGSRPTGPSRDLGATLVELAEVVRRRSVERPAGSYTVELLKGGTAAAARKVAEEAVETALAAVTEPDRVAEESADLLYHLLVLWRAAAVEPADVAALLAARRRGTPSGR